MKQKGLFLIITTLFGGCFWQSIASTSFMEKQLKKVSGAQYFSPSSFTDGVMSHSDTVLVEQKKKHFSFMDKFCLAMTFSIEKARRKANTSSKLQLGRLIPDNDIVRKGKPEGRTCSVSNWIYKCEEEAFQYAMSSYRR